MKKPSSPSVFRYIDPAKFLSDAHARLRLDGARMSIKAWAKLLGLPNSTLLSQILRGSRTIPAKLVPKLAKTLKLAGNERKYFEALAGISRAAEVREQELWMKRALKIYEAVRFELEAIESLRNHDRHLLTKGLMAHDGRGRIRRVRLPISLRQRRLNEIALAHAARALYSGRIEEREFLKTELPRAKKAIRIFTAMLIRQLSTETDESDLSVIRSRA